MSPNTAANMKQLRPFHLAFPVIDLKKSEEWYTQILGCSIGRKSDNWIDFNLFGHQIVAHLTENINKENTNTVDGDDVPIRHFGVILSIPKWNDLVSRLKNLNVQFLIKPHIRFKDLKGEQHTLFIKDPDGNALEFKAFKNDEMIFEH